LFEAQGVVLANVFDGVNLTALAEEVFNFSDMVDVDVNGDEVVACAVDDFMLNVGLGVAREVFG
jgi:hypothetical protein